MRCHFIRIGHQNQDEPEEVEANPEAEEGDYEANLSPCSLTESDDGCLGAANYATPNNPDDSGAENEEADNPNNPQPPQVINDDSGAENQEADNPNNPENDEADNPNATIVVVGCATTV